MVADSVEFDLVCVFDDRYLHGGGVSGGVFHRTFIGAVEESFDHAGDDSVLDEFFDPDVCVDNDIEPGGAGEWLVAFGGDCA